jgi:type VI secretion system protein ImpK
MISERSPFSTLENTQEWNNQLHNPPARLQDIQQSRAYYRSKLLTVNCGLNPIIKAAAPLLLLGNRLKTAIDNFDPLLFYHELCHEIHAFENKIQTENYPEHMIIAARYVLCVFIDEIILNTSWGKNSFWKHQNLLNTFQNATERDKFFIILERSIEKPEAHLDLLELIYLCIAFGYEGKHTDREQSNQRLNTIFDNLFRIICQTRETSEASSVNIPESMPSAKDSPLSYKWLFGLLVFFVASLIIVVYTTFNYSLDKKEANLQHELNLLESSNF